MNWKKSKLNDDAFSSSSEWNLEHSAKFCRLNSNDGKANWSAKKNDENQWIQVDLGKSELINKVAVQGRFNYAQWVTKYNLLISSDLKNWTKFEKIEGSIDQETVSIYQLPQPVKGQFVRFVPLEWNGHISMRIDVATISSDLHWLGDKIKDSSFSSSSDFNLDHAAKFGRLNLTIGKANWSAKKNDEKQWLQVDIGKVETVVAVAVQGRYNSDQWVTKYDLHISSDLENWTKIENITGCNERDAVNQYFFDQNISGRYVRLLPKEWHKHISMRVDIAILEIPNVISKNQKTEKVKNITEEIKVNKTQSKEDLLKIKEEELAKKEHELNLKLAKIAAQEEEERQKNHIIQEAQKRKDEELKQLEDKKRKDAELLAEIERKRKEDILKSVLIPYQSKEGEKLWGYVDIKMNWVIKPKYKYAGPFFDNGVAFVYLSSSSDIMINKLGEEVLNGFKRIDQNDTNNYYIEKSRKEIFNQLKSKERFYFEHSYRGLIPVKVTNEKQSFIDLENKTFYKSNFNNVSTIGYGFFETAGDKKQLLYLNGKVLIDSYSYCSNLRDNNFSIVFEKNTNSRYFRFIEKTESLEEFKLDFTLKQGESVRIVFKGYFEVENYNLGFVKYFKDGKQISEFKKYTKLFCIDTLGNHIVKDFGSYDEIGEKYFWLDEAYSQIVSLKNNQTIYSQGKPKGYADNYNTLTSLFIKKNDNDELLFIDWLTGDSKELKVNEDYEVIRDLDFYFGLQKTYGDYSDYLIDQSGNIVLDNFKKKGYYSQIKTAKVPNWFFIIQSGQEFLVDNNGFCHNKGKNIEELFLIKQNSFSENDIEPLIKIAKEGKIIEDQVLVKVKNLNHLKYLQLFYLNSKNNRDGGENIAARSILLYLGITIQTIKFAVKIKSDIISEFNSKRIIKKGTLVEFKAYHYSKEKSKLKKGETITYLEYTWLQKGGRFDSDDSILGTYYDGGDNRFWEKVGFYSHRKGASCITKPEILEII